MYCPASRQELGKLGMSVLLHPLTNGLQPLFSYLGPMREMRRRAFPEAPFIECVSWFPDNVAEAGELPMSSLKA